VVQEPGRTATWLVQTTYDWLVVMAVGYVSLPTSFL
ncbi:hypothetical protein PSYJA_46581, partial [Pseudomonas syringae pv. japonica str. M301072]